MNPKVMRGDSGEFETEALRVISNMPDWAPGKLGGKAVKVSLTLPVKFAL